MGKKNKHKLVEKVAQETGAEAKDLERLPSDSLEKIDAAVPDKEFEDISVDLEEVDVDGLNAEAEVVLAEAELEEGQEEPKVDIEVMDEEVKPRRCVGRHPITKEPIYR